MSKGGWNEQQQFAFRGVDQVVNAVGPALREHGVTVLPQRVRLIEATEYESKRGGRMVNRVVHVRWEIRGPGGDVMRAESLGEAADMSDKGVSKALSVAYRVLLLQALAIPTGNPDPDLEVHERASGSVDYASTSEARRLSNEARGELLTKTSEYGWDGDRLVSRFRQDYNANLLDVDDVPLITQFGDILVAEAKAQEDAAGQDDS